MKIVFDSNVLLAAHIARGLANTVYEYCLKQHEIFVSAVILKEMEAGFLRKTKIPPERVALILDAVKRIAVIGEIADIPKNACRDPRDLHVLGLAVKSGADLIISGDIDLLEIGIFRGIPIETPRRFLEKEREERKRNSGREQQEKPRTVHERRESIYRTASKKRRS